MENQGLWKKNIIKLFVLLAGLLSPLIPLLFFFHGNWSYLFNLYFLSLFFGIISYSYFLNVLILSVRIPVLDRLYGHDRVMQFHGYWAAFAFFFAAIHFFLKLLLFDGPTVQSLLGSLSFILFFLAILIALLLMVKTQLNKLKFWQHLISGIKSRFNPDYTQLKLFHNITALAITVLLIHVQLAYSTREALDRQIVLAIWGGLALLLYLFHKLIRPLLRLKSAFTITSNTPLSPNVTEICFHAASGVKLQHKAGQFAFFRILSNACSHEEHPFTIASAPDSDESRIVVKSLGNYSKSLRQVKKGEKIIVDGPYGIFSPRDDANSYFFLAGGIGITPFLSILEKWDKEGLLNKKPCHLLWTVQQNHDLINRTFFRDLEKHYPLFTFTPLISETKDGASNQRITKGFLENIIRAKQEEQAPIYFCGPDSLRELVTEVSKTLNYPSALFHYEKFSF